MKLTRSPAVSYLWMAIAITVVAALFSGWRWFVSHGHQLLWWVLLVVFLVADYLFLLIPIQDSKSIRRLSPAGRIWAAAAWVCCVAYLVIIAREIKPVSSNRNLIIELGLLGFLLLAMLVFCIYRLSREWIRESLRSIVARNGGGFLVRFLADPEITQSLGTIPGAQPLPGANQWSVPADPVAAAALLQFAKKHDFDFVPAKNTFEKELLRGR